MLLLLHHRLAQPCQCIPQVVYRLTNRFRLHLHQVDVFRIARLRLQIQLMQCRATSECQMLCQKRILIYRNQCPTDDQVLLHLSQTSPWSNLAPLCDKRPLYHNSSISISWFTITFHFLSTSAPSVATPILRGTAFIFSPSSRIKPYNPSATSCSSNTKSSK